MDIASLWSLRLLLPVVVSLASFHINLAIWWARTRLNAMLVAYPRSTSAWLLVRTKMMKEMVNKMREMEKMKTKMKMVWWMQANCVTTTDIWINTYVWMHGSFRSRLGLNVIHHQYADIIAKLATQPQLFEATVENKLTEAEHKPNTTMQWHVSKVAPKIAPPKTAERRPRLPPAAPHTLPRA